MYSNKASDRNKPDWNRAWSGYKREFGLISYMNLSDFIFQLLVLIIPCSALD